MEICHYFQNFTTLRQNGRPEEKDQEQDSRSFEYIFPWRGII